MVIEKLVRSEADCVTWSIVNIPYESTPTEIKIGLPAAFPVPTVRCQWRGRTIDMIEPQADGIGIDLETGEIIDVSGLW